MNSFFLVNKLNLFEEKERNNLFNEMREKVYKELNVSLNLGQNCFIINAKAKNLEVNKHLSFLNYTNYIINRRDLEEYINIVTLLKNAFQEDFNFTVPENLEAISKSHSIHKGYEEFIDLIRINKILVGLFDEYYYNYFYQKFNELKNSIKMDLDGIQLKQVIKGKIRQNIDSFIYDHTFSDLLRSLKIDKKELLKDFMKNIHIENAFGLIQILN